jgi:hypothetical protein
LALVSDIEKELILVNLSEKSVIKTVSIKHIKVAANESSIFVTSEEGKLASYSIESILA